MAQFRVLRSTFLLVLAAVTSVECFPTGAGTQACETLVPLHGPQPQPLPAPYAISFNPTTFTRGDQILVTVSATEANAAVYRGLALQARAANGRPDSIGTFTILDQNNFQFYDCTAETNGSPTGGVTHTNRNDKTLPQIFLWRPDEDFIGNVQFRLTVVQNFATFWTNIPSELLLQEPTVNSPPVLSCPGPLSVASDPGNVGSTVTFIPSCTDPDQPDPTLTVNCSPASNTFFPLGESRVVCVCTDNQGATDFCTIPVTVTPVIANTPPDITCPGPVTVTSLPQIDGNVVSFDDPTCTDVDQPGVNLPLTCSPSSNTFFQGLGTTIVTCTCTDNQGATDTCTIPVTITSVNTPPGIICPGPVTVTSLPQIEGNIVSFDDPTCTDVDQPGANLPLTCSPASNTFFRGLGTTIVTCTCTDNQGATDTCTISVTIRPTSVNTPPVITCPGPVVVPPRQQTQGNVASWNDPTCTDVDQPGDNLPTTCTPPSGSFFQGLGPNVVTCTCTDNQGEVDTCTISVTIASLGGVCDSLNNPCFPNECRPEGTDRFTCHSMTGSPCPGL